MALVYSPQCRCEEVKKINPEKKVKEKVRLFSIAIKETRFLTNKEKEVLRSQLKAGSPISIQTYTYMDNVGYERATAPSMATEITFWEK